MNRSLATLLALAALLVPSTALADDTEADASSTELDPADASAERELPADDPDDGFDWLVVPVVAYQPETSGLAAAVAILSYELDSNPENADSQSVLAAAYTLKNQFRVTSSNELRYERYGIKLQFEGRVWPREYFGLGPDNPLDAEELIEVQDFRSSVVPRYYLFEDRLQLGVISEFLTAVVTPESDESALVADDPAGRRGGIINGLGAEVRWDTRDRSFSTREGVYADFEVVHFDDALASDFTFTRATVDLRQYLTPGEWGTFAYQLVYQAMSGDTPFFERATIGGSDLVRGVFENRFNGETLAAAQLDYRSPLWWRIRGVVFGGLGFVGESPDSLALDLPRWGVGAGVRFIADKDRGIPIRLDFGVSEDDYGIYFSVSEPF